MTTLSKEELKGIKFLSDRIAKANQARAAACWQEIEGVLKRHHCALEGWGAITHKGVERGVECIAMPEPDE